MLKVRDLIICWLVLLCAVPSWAQNGSYFLSNHSPSEETFDNVCFDMAQDRNGIMYFAMKAGILEFDGREWDLIPGAGAIYALNQDQSGEIFWVGAKGFGKVGYDRNGFKQIQYLSDSTVSDVFQTLSIEDDVYFLSENEIFLHRSKESKTEVVISGSSQTIFSGMFELFGSVYVQTERNTTFRVENKKLVYVNLNFSGNVLFHSRLDSTYVLGTSDNRVYVCGPDQKVRKLDIQDQPYADANVVVSGTWIRKDLLALGTLRGGVMLINPATGARDQIIDYSTGLPDNEVFCLMADASQNVWVAHDYGFTQVSPAMPFRSFSYYAGLEGNMLCAYSYRDDVYVGTSLGLFKLAKDEVYADVVSYVDVKIESEGDSIAGDQSGAGDPQAQEAPSSKRRGFLNFLRRNRNKEQDGETETPPNGKPGEGLDDVKDPDSGGPNVRREKRVDSVLRSSQYVYKKVGGIDAKITHLVETDGKLIAAGLGGVFEVKNLVAEPIMLSPTRYIYASQKKNTVIASTYNDEIRSLHSQNGWQQQNLINGLGDQIDFVFEGSENEWWLCGLDRIYQLQLNETGIQRLRTIELKNPNFEKTVGLALNDRIFFVNTDGFYEFHRKKGALIRIDSLSKPYQYFAFDGHILYRDEHRWNVFGKDDRQHNLQLLNLFQNLRFVTTDRNPQNLWMIGGSNELLKFDGENISIVQSQFPIFLKSMQNNGIKIADFSHIELAQRNSAVTFEVVQPDFINPKGIEFRFFLEGMHQGWSDWSAANNEINFPYLPPGEYNLRVQARNIFGKVTDLAPLPFEVYPPYWKQSWFYALEFIIFASLVILSFRLSTRYRIVSRFLSLITIILLIEFIQTVIGSTIASGDTPVVEFIIQVVVAILILPVEGFLRNLMLRSLDSSGRLYKFISTAESPPVLTGKKPPRKKKIKEPL
jgi:hypothetical protein